MADPQSLSRTPGTLQITAWGIVALCVTVGGIVGYNIHPEPVPEILKEGGSGHSEAEPDEKTGLLPQQQQHA